MRTFARGQRRYGVSNSYFPPAATWSRVFTIGAPSRHSRSSRRATTYRSGRSSGGGPAIGSQFPEKPFHVVAQACEPPFPLQTASGEQVLFVAFPSPAAEFRAAD